MKLCFVTQYFPPETGACSARMYGFARELARMGCEVTVLTGFPNYPTGRWHQSYAGRVRPALTETIDGVTVRRVWLVPDTRTSALRRLASYTSFMLAATGAGVFTERPDVVVGTSGPMFAAAAAMTLGAAWRVPFIFDVRDLWPDLICQATGMSRNAGIRLLERLERLMYRKSAAITAVTQGLVDDLLAKGVPARKVVLLRNGVDTELYRPLGVDRGALRRKWGIPQGATVAIYAGTIGLLQSLETLVEAARDLAGVFVVIVGDGPRRREVEELARDAGDVLVLPNQPEENVVELMNASDVGVNPNTDVPINRKALGVKTYAYMACGLPYLIANAGECELFHRDAQAGVCVPPEDVRAMRDALIFFRDNPEEARAMGERGLAYVKEHHSRRALAERLLSVARRACGGAGA